MLIFNNLPVILILSPIHRFVIIIIMSDSQYYLGEGGVDLSGKFSGPFMLSTVRWPYWHMAENGCRNVAGTSGDPGKAGYFVFEKRGSPPNEYYLISPQSYPKEAVYMGSDPCGNVQIKPLPDDDTSGHWKIEYRLTTTITENGCQRSVPYYQFSPLRWSNWLMYVDKDSTGNVRGICREYPGPQGEILFKKIPC